MWYEGEVARIRNFEEHIMRKNHFGDPRTEIRPLKGY
jgi:hypothetical protein